MLTSLLYVSDSRLALGARELDAIVAASLRNNAAAGISGALISTRTRFAQLIEGPEAAVDDLMARILADPRHERVRVIVRRWVLVRVMHDWRLAYAGSSSFVEQQISTLSAEPPSPFAHEEAVTRFMSMLTRLGVSTPPAKPVTA